jgi:hypothetical protein
MKYYIYCMINKHIISKILHQAKHDGFIRFKDGNRINYAYNNLESIKFSIAIKSIGTKSTTDWDAYLTKCEKELVLKNRNIFIDHLIKERHSHVIHDAHENHPNKSN